MSEHFEDILRFDADALAPLRARVCKKDLDVVLHTCGSPIAIDYILQVLKAGKIYPAKTALSWNLEAGNPKLEHILRNTPLRVFGTYPRHLLHACHSGCDHPYLEQATVDDAGGAKKTRTASGPTDDWHLQHHAWLEKNGYMNRVVIGPDCCPGAFDGQDLHGDRWNALQRFYNEELPKKPFVQ